MNNPLFEFQKIFDDEIKLSMVIVLNLYNSLNLKQLSIILEKPEATLFRRIKPLLTAGIIQLNVEKSSQNGGKFYELTPSIRPLLQDTMINYGKNENDFSGIKASILSKKFQAVGNLAMNLANTTARMLSNQDYQNELIDHKLSLFTICKHLHLETSDDITEFQTDLDEFLEKIQKFEQKYLSKDSNSSHLFYFSINPLKTE